MTRKLAHASMSELGIHRSEEQAPSRQETDTSRTLCWHSMVTLRAECSAIRLFQGGTVTTRC